MKLKLLTLLLGLSLSAAVGAADKWENFSNPLPNRSAVNFGAKGILIATGGGVRYRTPSSDYIYHSEHGLESSDIYGVASSEKGYFAVSRNGIVSVMDGNGLSWRVLSRSYVANKSDVVPGAMSADEDVLTIGFEDRLAFFDAPKAYSILTINRIGDQFLTTNHLSKLVTHEDSLFVQLEKGQTFVRKMDWKNLESDIKLVDPDSWSILPSEQVVKGLEVWDSTKVVVDGMVIDNPDLFEHVVNRSEKPPYDILEEYDRSLIHQVIPVEGGYYLMGPKDLYFYDGKEFVDLVDNLEFPLDDAYEVEAFPGGGSYVVSTKGEFSLNDTYQWSTENISTPAGSGSTSYTSRLKSFTYLPDGNVLFHVWGNGYYGYSAWGAIIQYDISIDRGVCIASYDNVSNYIISVSVIPAPDNSGFITIAGSFSGYSLAYITKNGEVSCANHIGKSFIAAPFHSTIDENGHWVIYATTRGETGLSSNGGLDVIRMQSPRSHGGEIVLVDTIKNVKGTSQTPVDMVYQPNQKRMWMVTSSNLAYYDQERDTLIQPPSIKGIGGVEFTSIDSDPHGNLWVGTADNGAYMVSMVGKSPDTLKAINFSAKNGMLSDRVNDLSVDSVQGKVWFAHENGVSTLLRMEARDASKFMTDSAKAVKAYPIPFRPRVHRNFIIDNIDESAVVSIYNRGGSLIRSFHGSEVLGGRVTWDGCDKKGVWVTPGVYFYVVKTSSKAKKGKFLVIY